MSPSRANNAAVTACGGLVTAAAVADRVPVTSSGAPRGPGCLLQAQSRQPRRSGWAWEARQDGGMNETL